MDIEEPAVFAIITAWCVVHNLICINYTAHTHTHTYNLMDGRMLTKILGVWVNSTHFLELFCIE